MKTTLTRVALIESDPLLSRSFQAALKLQPDLDCQVAVRYTEDLILMSPEVRAPQIIMYDDEGQLQSTQENIKSLRSLFPKSEIIVLTNSTDQEHLIEVLNLGANGYLLKDFPPNQLPTYIRQALKGGIAMSPQMCRKLINFFHPKQQPITNFSTHEIKVLNFLSKGMTYDEIALRIGISTNGVRYHIKNVYAKLGVSNKVDAVITWKEITDKNSLPYN
jgi:DNA-binding NarL/FixJ family response regulator